MSNSNQFTENHKRHKVKI